MTSAVRVSLGSSARRSPPDGIGANRSWRLDGTGGAEARILRRLTSHVRSLIPGRTIWGCEVDAPHFAECEELCAANPRDTVTCLEKTMMKISFTSVAVASAFALSCSSSEDAGGGGSAPGGVIAQNQGQTLAVASDGLHVYWASKMTGKIKIGRAHV